MSDNATDIIRIANCSGYYGDKLSAAREMVEGGPIDVLTGDYLAELTMSILFAKKMKSPDEGYVGTFLKQVKDVLELCLEKNIKIVSNAGGLNPKGMAEEVEKIAAELGVTCRVAYVDGDNMLPRIKDLASEGETFTNIDTGQELKESGLRPATANAYLGGWGIKEALDQGADVVIAPRVTDAAVVMGPAAWKFNWKRDDFDALAGACAAGHLIECGAQVCGGNYAFFEEVPSFANVGYPIAEIESDGSFTITKQEGTGGLVSVGTVTAQLLYEINDPAYKNPDVISHFDTLQMEQVGENRVRVSGCRGSNPPAEHKVCMNIMGGFKNSMELLVTGLDIEKKVEIFTEELFRQVGGKDLFDDVDINLVRTDKEDADTNDEAMALLRITVKSSDPKLVGRIFSAKVIEIALATYPGFTGRSAPGGGGPFVLHWPALVDSRHITEHVHMGGEVTDVPPTNQLDLEEIYYQKPVVDIAKPASSDMGDIHFGRVFGTRSGDKGGAANIGVWAKTDEAYQWLYHNMTAEKLKEMMPEVEGYEVKRFDLPNIRAVNFMIYGILGDGVAANTRIDGQAKSMGEFLRSRKVALPKSIFPDAA
ncbi:acyclic terpene utilization AtuA family protein [Sneathiella sp. P13V-1]|uniref:acyclic terpene utilization AtuA family protein n=1 Tax=Sneathiella sp. P13V-1 TaxID=2697366 RepID=UPI00187B1CEE|nr:acyclic terpene utilization AtuA family protein [Sneathiella sp. P13V-1]MBE7636000.1 acyclic terpene utilization AtuA family protein [Sneathiella sp. P13V-1]